METQLTVLPDKTATQQAFVAIHQFQEIVHSQMRKDHDYGVIPGTSKPTLLKPGAEKIAKLLGLADQYEIMDRQEDWNKPFFRYLIKCSLVSVGNGVTISEGMGECNSMEAKYRWREAKKKCPECGAEAIIKGKEQYGGGWICFGKRGGCGAKWKDGDPVIESQKTGKVENEDIYSQVNTILKMAKKRALVDASLSAGRLSELFTQDIEDMVIDGSFEVAPDSNGEQQKQEAKLKKETKPKQEKPANGDNQINWGKVTKLAGKMGLKDVAEVSKALKVKQPNDWKDTEETALDTIEEYARLNSYTGPNWREIE